MCRPTGRIGTDFHSLEWGRLIELNWTTCISQTWHFLDKTLLSTWNIMDKQNKRLKLHCTFDSLSTRELCPNSPRVSLFTPSDGTQVFLIARQCIVGRCNRYNLINYFVVYTVTVYLMIIGLFYPMADLIDQPIGNSTKITCSATYASLKTGKTKKKIFLFI